MGTIIIGNGHYLPTLIYSNEALIDEFKIQSNDAWIKTNLGIEQRHWAPAGINTSTLAFEAGSRALLKANIPATELSRIIIGTSTADHTNISTANKVQHLLGSNAPSFDIIAACASFILALEVAIEYVTLSHKTMLVIGADIKSRFVNKDDRKFLPIFGDGAGALVLTEGKSDEGFIKTKIWSDGSYYEELTNPAGGSAMPATEETVKQKLHATKMKIDGKLVTLKAAEMMADLAKSVCEDAGISMNEISYVIPHHANIVIMKHFLQMTSIPQTKLFSTISYTGNLVAASIPYAFSSLLDEKAKPGDLILLVAIGAGASGGAMLYRVPNIQVK